MRKMLMLVMLLLVIATNSFALTCSTTQDAPMFVNVEDLSNTAQIKTLLKQGKARMIMKGTSVDVLSLQDEWAEVKVYGKKLYTDKQFISCIPWASTPTQSTPPHYSTSSSSHGTITECNTNNLYIIINTTGPIPDVTLRINCKGILFRSCYTWKGDLKEGENRISTPRFTDDDGKKFNPNEYSVKKMSVSIFGRAGEGKDYYWKD